jgi:hypothetical protein
MSLAGDSLASDVRQHFKVEIERKIFDAAVLGFDSEDNPLRLNNFAFAMRELGRIWLEHLAEMTVPSCMIVTHLIASLNQTRSAHWKSRLSLDRSSSTQIAFMTMARNLEMT